MPDLKFALRSLLQTPRLTLTLLACIAVSIGGTATVLTFVHSLLLRPLPFPQPKRLVLVEPADRERSPGSRPYFSYPDFSDLRDATQSFELIAGATVSRLVMATGGGTERLRGETVTPGYFELFGLRPQLGQPFAAEHYAGQGDRAILLSSRLWRTRFGADPGLIGQPVTTNAGPAVVVGVMPEGYLGVAEDEGTDYWLAERQGNHPQMLTDRAAPTTLVFGRLKPGISASQAEAEVRGILEGLNAAHPEANRKLDAHLVPFGEKWREPLRLGLTLLLVGSGFLLAIGCGNVAILLLARLVTRERELAVRLALGASRRHLLRLMFAESMVLALAGGAAGLVLASWLKSLFVETAGLALPLHLPVAFGFGPLLLCLAAVLATGLVFGLLPALVATRLDGHAALRASGRGVASGTLQGRGGRLLVIGQTALSAALLGGAGLVLRSYEQLRYADFGYRTDRLLRYQVSLQRATHPTAESADTFFRNLDHELRALPGVRAIGYLGPTLPPYDANEVDLRLKGAGFATADGTLRINQHFATNEIFSILRVPLREGRFFGPEDARDSQVVGLVSETLAQHIAPGGSALGRTLLYNGTTEVVVVGVVADARWNGQRNRNPSGLNLFLSLRQFPQHSVGVLFDSGGDPRALIEPVRRTVVARDGTAALHWIDTMEEALDFQTANERFWAVLASAYAGTAFVLAGLGLYGVLTHGVVSRRREIGIRLALGATPLHVSRLVVTQGLRLVVPGLAAGLASTLLLGRWIESKLHGISPHDPLTYGLAATLLLLASIAICWLPARRASRIDPTTALRSE